MRRKTKSITPKIAKQILEGTGVFTRDGEDLAKNPRYGPRIQAARLRLIRSLPECVRQIEAALSRADFTTIRWLARPLPDGRFLLSQGAVTLQKLGRSDLVERAMIYVSLFPDHDPSPQELARLKAQALPRSRSIQ